MLSNIRKPHKMLLQMISFYTNIDSIPSGKQHQATHPNQMMFYLP